MLPEDTVDRLRAALEASELYQVWTFEAVRNPKGVPGAHTTATIQIRDAGPSRPNGRYAVSVTQDGRYVAGNPAATISGAISAVGVHLTQLDGGNGYPVQ